MPAARARELESLLAFWLDAGADVAYAEAPVDRRRAPERRLVPPPSPAVRPRAAAVSAGPDAIAEARRAAAGAANLEALAAAIAAFDGCPLKTLGARRAVTWRGPVDAPVLLIGEGPGAEEDAQGLPFVGRAGKLLDKMLEAAGLAGRVFITNTVFWRPPGNRNPTPAEQAACAPFLERAIRLVQPRLLLVVGAPASRALFNAGEGILALRGQWREWSGAAGDLRLPALPTLHPAFLLRTPAAKRLAWADLLSLAARLETMP